LVRARLLAQGSEQCAARWASGGAWRGRAHGERTGEDERTAGSRIQAAGAGREGRGRAVSRVAATGPDSAPPGRDASLAAAARGWEGAVGREMGRRLEGGRLQGAGGWLGAGGCRGGGCRGGELSQRLWRLQEKKKEKP
jgi:hypothetical protein